MEGTTPANCQRKLRRGGICVKSERTFKPSPRDKKKGTYMTTAVAHVGSSKTIVFTEWSAMSTDATNSHAMYVEESRRCGRR